MKNVWRKVNKVGYEDEIGRKHRIEWEGNEILCSWKPSSQTLEGLRTLSCNQSQVGRETEKCRSQDFILNEQVIVGRRQIHIMLSPCWNWGHASQPTQQVTCAYAWVVVYINTWFLSSSSSSILHVRAFFPFDELGLSYVIEK